MTIFTVHIPVGARDHEKIADQIRAIPDTVSWSAFLFGPVWLAAQGAWLAASGFALAMAALVSAQIILGLSAGGLLLTLLLIQLFIGLEGRQMARAAIRRRFDLVDVVNATTAEEAEHIALRRLISSQSARPARPAAPIYMHDGDVPGIGLFPDAGA